MKHMILCECGEFIDANTFKDYIKTSSNPTTATMGHKNCGIIFNFVDGEPPRRYSSRINLKIMAGKFAKKRDMDYEKIGPFLLEVDRLKSKSDLPDADIIFQAFQSVQSADGICTKKEQ